MARDTLFIGAFGLVLIAFGFWLYLSPSAERFYRARLWQLWSFGWMMTGILPFGEGALLIAIGTLFPTGSLAGQIFVGAGFMACVVGFGLILIHPNRVRPKWLRGKVGD